MTKHHLDDVPMHPIAREALLEMVERQRGASDQSAEPMSLTKLVVRRLFSIRKRTKAYWDGRLHQELYRHAQEKKDR